MYSSWAGGIARTTVDSDEHGGQGKDGGVGSHTTIRNSNSSMLVRT